MLLSRIEIEQQIHSTYRCAVKYQYNKFQIIQTKKGKKTMFYFEMKNNSNYNCLMRIYVFRYNKSVVCI